MNTPTITQHNTKQVAFIYFQEAMTELIKTFRSPGFVLPSLMFPVMFYLFFGVVFSSQAGPEVATYLLATYGVFGVMGPALFSFGAEVAVERDRGMLAIKQISPMPIPAYFFAKVVTALSFASIIVAMLFTLAITAGGVRMEPLQWFATYMMLMTGVLPFCVIGLLIGLVVKAQAAAAVVNLIYLPMSFLSGLWIPVMQFPEFLQKVATFLPPFHFAQLVLKIQGSDIGMAWWIHVLALLAYTIIFGLMAVTAFRKAETR